MASSSLEMAARAAPSSCVLQVRRASMSSRRRSAAALRARDQTPALVEADRVHPNAGGGHVTNYPNPFHPGEAPTTIAYKLDDNASVRMRIFTLAGRLVLPGVASVNHITYREGFLFVATGRGGLPGRRQTGPYPRPPAGRRTAHRVVHP